MNKREIIVYETVNGVKPFEDWFNSIKDPVMQYKIANRIDRIKKSNMGDCKSLGKGICELRFHFSSGYRLYYSEIDNVILLFLCGGDKNSQKRDIKKAIEYLNDYKERIK